MKKRIAINGFGRIGRLAYKELLNEEVHIEGDEIVCKDIHTKIFAIRDARELPWKELKIDIVLECTGVYTKLEDAKSHIEAGAKHVLISAPGKGEMKTVVYGVNESILDGTEEVVSAASCTTNCLAPVLNILNGEYGVESGFMTTVHAYTNDQVNLDVQHKKGYMTRRGRACALNIIPSSTGAASAIGKVIPELNGKLLGSALRVPVGDGSMIDLTLKLRKKVTKEEINDLFEKNVDDVLNVTKDPIVSSDVIGQKCGSLVDLLLTEVLDVEDGQLVKVVAWYDNEGGYTAQMIRTMKHLCSLQK